MTLVWSEEHDENWDWSWKYHKRSENLLAEYLEAKDDVAANHALHELEITPIFVWLGRYGVSQSTLCWTLLGKELKYQEAGAPQEVDEFCWDEEPEVEMAWFIDGERIDRDDFWVYIHSWILSELVETGIIMDSRK